MSFPAKVTWELQLLLSARGLSSEVTVFAPLGQGPGSLDLSSADGCLRIRLRLCPCARGRRSVGVWHPAVLPVPWDLSGWLDAKLSIHRVSTGDVEFNCLIIGELRFQGAALETR